MAGRLTHYAKRVLMLGGFVALTACYHSITTTNLTAGPTHVVPWAPAFIGGIVPAKVDAGKLCGGKPVQAVDAQASFLNVLVGFVTGGIFTPYQITVTCAG